MAKLHFIATDGDDGSDGLTPATAWATLAKLNTAIAAMPDGESLLAIVAAGSYAGSGLFLGNTNNVLVGVLFEEGVTVDTSGNVGAMAGISVNDSGGQMVCFLNGAAFIGNANSSANGIGLTGGGKLIVRGAANDGTRATFTGYDDGISAHTTANGSQIYDCEFIDCEKSALYHVNDSSAHHYNCIFHGFIGQALIAGNSSSRWYSSTFTNCQFIPAAASQVTNIPGVCYRCSFGTPDLPISVGGIHNSRTTLMDCYINVYSPTASQNSGPGQPIMIGNWGQFTINRIRGNATNPGLFAQNIFEGDFLGSNYAVDDGTWLGGDYLIFDNIFEDASHVIDDGGRSYIADRVNDWVIRNNIAYNVTTPFEAGATSPTDTITTDPLTGARDTVDAADWGWAGASPAIDAGIAATDIGFEAPAAVVTPTYADASDVRFGVDRGDGTNGTCYVPSAAEVLSGVNVDDTTGTVVLPSAATVLDSVSYGAASGTTGTYHAPEASEVVNTASFGDGSSVDGTAPVLEDVLTAIANLPSVEADEAAIAAAVLAGIQPSSNTFTGSVVTPGQETITVYQRDDYSASDGRAFDFAIVDAAIDFTNATVIKGPAGGQRSLVSDRIEATLSLQNKLNGSCTLRIEFTSAQLNQPAGQYQFNALVLVNGRRVTKLDLIVNVEPQNADTAS